MAAVGILVSHSWLGDVGSIRLCEVKRVWSSHATPARHVYFYSGAICFRSEMFLSAEIDRRDSSSRWLPICVLLEFSHGAL